MSYVLIDNSTLTSVQRLLGEIQINNKNIIEGDILATENLIQSILFYDDILVIDDYKEEFKEERKKRFDFIKFLSPKDFDFESIQDSAKKEAIGFQPKIEGGQFKDEDFRKLLELLNLNIITTWDISSSEYYLNLKLLGYNCDDEYDKYNQIGSLIFNEISDTNEKGNFNCSLYDSQGNKINKGYKVLNAKWQNDGKTASKLLKPQLWSFVASLNWIAYKSIYYTHVANYFKSDLFLHPIRQGFNIHYLNKVNNYDDSLLSNIIKELKDYSIDTIKVIKQSMNPSIEKLNLPYFSFYLVNQTKDSKYLIEKAYDIRTRQCFIDAREQLAELNNLIYEENDLAKFSKESKKIKENIFKTIESIKANYGLATGQGIHLNNLIKVVNSTFSISIPDIFEKKITLPAYLKKQPKGLSMVYRDITEDLSKVSKFGKYHELLTSNIDLIPKGEGRFDFEFNCEDPKYMYSSSRFKSPM